MNIAFAGLRHDHIYVLYDMAKNHSDYNIIGEFEENSEAREKALSKGLSCRYKSYDELLADENVDVVALGGCYGDRGQMAIDALKSGKHVIADKPLCTSLEELDLIEKEALKSGCRVSCMFTMRYEKKINAVKRLYESGVLGEINNISFGGQHPLMYGRRPMWYFEDGRHGGVINDIAIHAMDIISYAFGIKVKNILAARCWNKFAKEEKAFKDSAQFMLESENGAGIIGDVSYAVPDGVEFALPYYWQFYVWGTKGTISFSLNEEESFYYVSGNKEPIKLMENDVYADYLTDFLKNDNIKMSDVFNATRKTLEMQKFSDEKMYDRVIS